MTPILRWAGAKRWLAEQLSSEILLHKPKVYHEPFLGAGAVALAIGSALPSQKMVLADLNSPLMNLWSMVKKYPEAVAKAAKTCLDQYGNNQEGYIKARERFNAQPSKTGVDIAGLMIYLNTVCFNGLWRENKQGQMNVPFGRVKNPSTSSKEELMAFSKLLANTILMKLPFQGTIPLAKEGDCAYIDPPYDEGFVAYTSSGFTQGDQRELASMLKEAAENRAVKVWATNSDTLLIREIYSWANIEEIDEPRAIAADKEKRQKAKCLLIRSKNI